jgi:aromatic-L-amino-acid/L-tryptophan decarboxylase
MMNKEEFRESGYQLIDWIVDYYENIDSFPVKSHASPREIYNKIPDTPPESGENIKNIIQDFQDIIPPGMTHWQNPRFHAYFPANSSFPSILGEILTAGLAAQCMVWDTSPAAAELEEKMMIWLRDMLGLPDFFQGVIQDSASSATLVALLSAREKVSGFKTNLHGMTIEPVYRVYCSAEAHSSIEKGAKIAGFGSRNVVKVEVDDNLAMIPESLKEAIETDKQDGKIPVCVVAALGTTGTVAIDPLPEIAKICQQHGIWFHVDAAFAGSALILDEYRWMLKGIDKADSFVFNPHKWMFTNFDCSAYFIKDKEILIRTFEILPEYLKTKSYKKVNDYRDWGVQLGRRFRALKLWFVIRDYGVEGIRSAFRQHIFLAQKFEKLIAQEKTFEMIVPRSINVICFRFNPQNGASENELNRMNAELLEQINKNGKLFLSHTKVKGKYTIRFVVAQTNVEEKHIDEDWEEIKKTACLLFPEPSKFER